MSHPWEREYFEKDIILCHLNIFLFFLVTARKSECKKADNGNEEAESLQEDTKAVASFFMPFGKGKKNE
jgi:hypothetical protein